MENTTSDYYLFDRLLGTEQGQNQEQGQNSEQTARQFNHYLTLFDLEKKVTLKDGRFSTLKLSDGQRRRLALIVAIVEDKSMYVFDEWAADQDPEFKHAFYREILPYLKSKDKAVVVISHDDRYFDMADQLLVMESGQLVTEQTRKETRSVTSASLNVDG